MFKLTKLLTITALISMLLGCSEAEKKEINTTKPVQKVTTKKSDETLLNEMGFDFKDEKIIIDLNKSSNFFSRMEKRMEEKAKEIENKIKNSDINVSRDSGVEITDDKLSIDLNQTKTLLDSFSKLFEDIILDINKTIN